MSSVTLLPNASSNTGNVTGLGGDADAVLADSDTATFIEYDFEEFSNLDYDNATIPADATVTSIVLYAQVAKVATSCRMDFSVLFGMAADPLPSVSRTFNYSSPTTITVPFVTGSDIDDAAIDALQATVTNKASDARLYRLAAVVNYSVVPTLTVDSPTGTITDHNIVTVGWTPTFDGTGTYGYEVKISDDSGFDPDTDTPILEASSTGLITPPTSHAFTEALASDTYYTHVRVTHVASNGETLTSDWETLTFVVDVDFPAAPTLTLTPDDDEAYIAVLCEVNAGDATTDWFEVQASEDGGTTWRSVRTPSEDGTIEVNEDDQGGTLDYEAPNGVTVTYRVRAVHDYGDGNTAASDWVTDTESWSSEQWWIKHPTQPSLNAAITLRSNAGYSRAVRQGVHRAILATNSVVVSDTPGPKQGEMVVLSDLSDGTHDALEALLEARVPLLWQGPQSNHQEDRWIVLTGFSASRVIDKGWASDVDDSLPWTQVGRPTDAQLVLSGLYPADELYPSDDLFPA
jgi:hypothetical protein